MERLFFNDIDPFRSKNYKRRLEITLENSKQNNKLLQLISLDNTYFNHIIVGRCSY